MALFWLSDEAWAAIEPHLPRNQPGARRVHDRRVISGTLHITVGSAARLGASQRFTTRRCASHRIATQRANRWGHPALSADGHPQAPEAPRR